MELLDDKLHLLRDLMESNAWLTISENNGIVTQKISLPRSKIACYRSYAMIGDKMDNILEYIWNAYNNHKHIKNFDHDISGYRVMNNVNENSRICYQINNLVWPFWPRDFIYFQTKIITDTESVILMYSTDSKDISIHNRYVRTATNISAFVIKDCEIGCMVYRIDHIDFGGIIPLATCNRYDNKTTDWIKKLKNIYG